MRLISKLSLSNSEALADASLSYGSYLFKNSLGFDSNLASLMSGFLFTWFFLSSFVPWFTLDTWGRKPLIIGSTAFMACLFVG